MSPWRGLLWTLPGLLWPLSGVALSGCLAGKVRYEPVAFPIEPVDETMDDLLSAWITDQAERGKLGRIELVTENGRDRLRVAELRELPLPVRYATLLTTDRWMRGAELDLLVGSPDGEVPVTVWRDPDATRVAYGDGPPMSLQPPPGRTALHWGEAMAEQYGLAGFEEGDVSWTMSEVAALGQGLSVLSAGELATLEGMVIGRGHVSPRRPADLALYDATVTPARMDFFDLAFGDLGQGFVGSVRHPWPTPVMTVVHELGHAVADVEARRAYEAYAAVFDAGGRTEDTEHARALWTEYQRAQRAEPVIRAYKAVRAGPGPTSYGWHNPHESFAEAFALYKLDPAALKRVAPEVFAWFEAGGHLEDSNSRL